MEYLTYIKLQVEIKKRGNPCQLYSYPILSWHCETFTSHVNFKKSNQIQMRERRLFLRDFYKSNLPMKNH